MSVLGPSRLTPVACKISGDQVQMECVYHCGKFYCFDPPPPRPQGPHTPYIITYGEGGTYEVRDPDAARRARMADWL